MNKELPRFILPLSVLDEIRRIVAQTPEGLETGVALLGARQVGFRTALCAVAPGPGAVQSPGWYEPDADYLNGEIQKLIVERPGLEWIGSLHVHPFGMPVLSGTDRGTLVQLLGDADLRLPDFIAGIIQRQHSRLAIYPYFVPAKDQFPWLLPVEVVESSSSTVQSAESQVRKAPAIGASVPAGNSANVPDCPHGILVRIFARMQRIFGTFIRAVKVKRRVCHERQSN
jgi:hypothetical protein